VGAQLAQFLLRRQAEARLQREREQQRQAAELNDDVVQGLEIANYALARGDVDAAMAVVTKTLRSAQAIVSDLLGEGPPEPGDLRREGEPDATAD
jgi:hypothetical protein